MFGVCFYKINTLFCSLLYTVYESNLIRTKSGYCAFRDGTYYIFPCAGRQQEDGENVYRSQYQHGFYLNY